MSSCGSSSSSTSTSCGFPSASTMDQMAINYSVISTEEAMIQQAILAAASQCQTGGGKFCTTVGGSTPMTFLTGVSSVTVVNGGNGYSQDTPTVAFVPPLNSTPTVIATGTLTTNGSSILSITITNPGLGYQPVPASLSVSTTTGSGASLVLLVDGAGHAAQVSITNGGSGYALNDSVVATRAVAPNSAYIDATFRITAVSVAGEILSVAVLNPGSGYQASVATVKIVSSINPTITYPLGTGFIGTVSTDSSGSITSVAINNMGAGYAVYPPYLVINDIGTGAQTAVTLGTGPNATSVASIAVIKSGNNYDQLATGTVNNPPTASAPSTPAVVTINVPINTYGTNSNLYWQVWAGTVTNKAISSQLNAVICYFTGLGYTISLQTNPATGTTLQWKICW